MRYLVCLRYNYIIKFYTSLVFIKVEHLYGSSPKGTMIVRMIHCWGTKGNFSMLETCELSEFSFELRDGQVNLKECYSSKLYQRKAQ